MVDDPRDESHPGPAPGVPADWLHPADLAAATAAQRAIAARVEERDRPEAEPGGDADGPRFVAGVDCSNNPRGAPDHVRALAVLLDRREGGRVVATAMAEGTPRFPYVPGFLGFREIPFVAEAVRRLPRRPALLMVDGHGLSHPRRCGTASHLGVVLDLPSIGVAKSILVGRPGDDLGDEAGSSVPLLWKGAPIGSVLRSRSGVQPIYVSVGHRVSADTALLRVLEWLRGRRLPEPTRLADQAAGAARRAASSA